MMLLVARAEAQRAPQALDVTRLSQEAVAVYRTWQEYLASKDGRFSSGAGVPSTHWVKSEQARWPVYDLAGFYLLDKAIPEVTAIDRSDGHEYRITTRFRSGDQSVRPPSWWTALTMTVYAERVGDRWLLANALPRHTRGWRRATVGPITYVYAPGYPYDPARAQRAVAFADSVASAFGLPRLAPLTYYLTLDVDEVYRIIGLESDLKFGPVGGAAQPANRTLFSGIPALGEEYRHELAHFVLAPLCCAGTSALVSEGVATWLGGTTGMDYPSSVRVLAAFLAEHGEVTIDSIVSGSFAATQSYPAGAVLAAMVFERGGARGVRELFTGSGTPAALRATMERQLRRPWPTIAQEWRRRVMGVASGTGDVRRIRPAVRHGRGVRLFRHHGVIGRRLNPGDPRAGRAPRAQVPVRAQMRSSLAGLACSPVAAYFGIPATNRAISVSSMVVPWCQREGDSPARDLRSAWAHAPARRGSG